MAKRIFKGVHSLIREHGRLFSLFFAIGIAKSIVTVILNWLLIDSIGIPALIGSSIVAVIVFLGVYGAYLFLDVVKPRFWTYTFATIAFSIAQIGMITLLVDGIGLSGAVSSALSIAVLFIVRYVFFRKIGLI